MPKKPKPDITPALMKTSELAARVGITAKRLRQWQAAGLHNIPRPAIQDATITYYSREDAMRWITALKKGEVR